MSRIVFLGDMEYISKDMYSITWELTKSCNYKCEYCSIFKNDISSPKHLEETINFLNIFGSDKNLKITLFGGEPTLCQDLEKIITNLSNEVNLFTNLSQDVSFYIDLKNNSKCFNITTSYHPTRVKFDKFLNKIISLRDTFSLKVIYMVGNYENPSDIFRNISELNSNGVEYEVSYIDNCNELEFLGVNDSERILDVKYSCGKCKKTTSSDISLSNKNMFKYYLCDGGKRNMFISNDGVIYPCQEYRHNNLKGKSIINFSIKDVAQTICTLDKCLSDLEIPKYSRLTLK